MHIHTPFFEPVMWYNGTATIHIVRNIKSYNSLPSNQVFHEHGIFWYLLKSLNKWDIYLKFLCHGYEFRELLIFIYIFYSLREKKRWSRIWCKGRVTWTSFSFPLAYFALSSTFSKLSARVISFSSIHPWSLTCSFFVLANIR